MGVLHYHDHPVDWIIPLIRRNSFRMVDGVEKETSAQGATDFGRWKKADSPYAVRYRSHVLDHDLPRVDDAADGVISDELIGQSTDRALLSWK